MLKASIHKVTVAMQKLALFSKPNCPDSWKVLNDLESWAKLAELTTFKGPELGGWNGTNYDEELVRYARQEADVAIAVGGDGTLLGMARNLFGTSVPVLGVNKGTLGFLTEVSAADIPKMVLELKSDHYDTEERVLLNAEIPGKKSALAFNDVVFSGQGRLARYDVYANGRPFFSLRADGLIIATPTGSTAYSLSAGGPILHPSLDVLALVPVQAHSMAARPYTLPAGYDIEVIVRESNRVRLDCDGQADETLLEENARVKITKASTSVHMLHLADYDPFNILREKLGWSMPRQD